MIIGRSGVPPSSSNSSEYGLGVIPTAILPIDDEQSGWQDKPAISEHQIVASPHNEAEMLKRWTKEVKDMASTALDQTVEKPRLAIAS